MRDSVGGLGEKNYSIISIMGDMVGVVGQGKWG